MLLASALAAAALGTTLGTFVKTEGQASGLSIMLGMVMALLGGCWYPIELFPQFVRTAVKVLPTTWAMQGMLDIVLRGQGLAGVLLPAGRAAGLCGRLLCHRGLAVPLRVKPASDECPGHEKRPTRRTSPGRPYRLLHNRRADTLPCSSALSGAVRRAGRLLLVAT